jgi:hypothetical protein
MIGETDEEEGKNSTFWDRRGGKKARRSRNQHTLEETILLGLNTIGRLERNVKNRFWIGKYWNGDLGDKNEAWDNANEVWKETPVTVRRVAQPAWLFVLWSVCFLPPRIKILV